VTRAWVGFGETCATRSHTRPQREFLTHFRRGAKPGFPLFSTHEREDTARC
jgi:hypothetical protein